MLAGRQGETCFGLPCSEVHVVLVVGDRLIEGRQRSVNDQVVVPGIRFVHACGRYAHFFQAEADNERIGHVGAVVGGYDVYERAGRRLMPSAFVSLGVVWAVSVGGGVVSLTITWIFSE